ncbi:MAG: hypothetical protein L0Y57_09685 [Beijerinckiaceae bacterium]|nr:hypothetical protein [Beijerinckiaceae bacterium]
MNLPDFFKFDLLNRLKNQMGISDDQYGSFSLEVDRGRLTREELDRLTGDGIDISFEELTILPDGTLALKDKRVLVYIRDLHIYGNEEREPRYHLVNCKTLVEMSQNGRFSRYVCANKPNGNFSLNIIRSGRAPFKEERRLAVCQNCLDGLKLNGFDLLGMNREHRRRFVAEFSPDDFFTLYPRSLHSEVPKYNSDSAPINDYPPDFPQISERLRRENGWRCEKCGNSFSGRHLRQYLQVHHVNGYRSDNSRQNLKILCIACHADEPRHSHMRSLPAYADFIKLNSTRRARQTGVFNPR